MKKLLCLLALVLLTQNSWARQIEGIVNYGRYVNCEIINDTASPITVLNYTYDVYYSNGRYSSHFIPCEYGCSIAANRMKRFTGPTNTADISEAFCYAETISFKDNY